MAFEAKKYGDILDAMQKSSLASGVVTDFEAGSVVRTLSESFAYEMALLYEKMRLVYLSAYVDTAQGQQLDNVVAILGIQRGEPDFAQGVVTFQGDASKDDTQIPAGTLVATEDKPNAPKKVFQTVETVTLVKGATSVDARVQAVVRGNTETAAVGAITVMPRPISGIKSVTNASAIAFTGKTGETDAQLRDRAKNTLISSGKATLVSIENALLSLPDVSDVKIIEHSGDAPPQYGLIDVYVDGVDLSDAARKAALTAAIDGVRAAGVFARLNGATDRNVVAVFQIQLAPDLKLTPAERADLENKASAAVSGYIDGLKMGQSLLLSQMIKSILAVDGVTDLVKYDISVNGTPAFQGPERSLDSKPSERFKPTLVCAASEVKQLLIDLQFKAIPGIDPAKLTQSLTNYFNGVPAGATIAHADLLNAIGAANIADQSTLVITPHSWCGQVTVNNTKDVIPKFVEKPALGQILAYSAVLNISGAVRLILSPQLTATQQNALEAQALQKIQALFSSLAPGQGIGFADLIAAVKTVPQVLDAQAASGDFTVWPAGTNTNLPARISSTKIDVQALEKPALDPTFCVTGSTRSLTVQITGLAVTVVVPGVAPNPPTTVQNQVAGGISGKPLLTGLAPGQNVAYNDVKSAIEALLAGTTLTVTAMTLSATADCGGRVQTINAPGTSILVRSVELAAVAPVTLNPNSVTVQGTHT